MTPDTNEATIDDHSQDATETNNVARTGWHAYWEG